ncbi:rhodopsin-like [Mizuhopecten yessoensis]|uniref:Rhodopsin n=1 Tax=Mizuhopecten yessoensis TaxID=6573 RepID=A0A210Q9P2_MIZYE|nr:rhodopsin-like [Mizuhopecten yessoensis]OWF45435.1 Rhodopsin [Mizuhopecten yessoensis]
MNLSFEPSFNQTNVTTAPNIEVNQQHMLNAFNSNLAQTLLPLTVVLWFYLVIGFLGNSLVMFVYWARKKPMRDDRYFIPLLALMDLISCVVSSGTGIHAQTHPLMFDNNVGCKMAAFLGILFACVSADFLLVIAIERYIKLCRPFGRQMTIFIKKAIIVVITLFGLVLSVPALGIYQVEEIPKMRNMYGIQAWQCTDMKDKGQATGHTVYKVSLFVVTITRFVILFFCYGNISWVIFRQGKFRQRMGSVVSCTSATSVSYTDDAGKSIGMNKQNSEGSKSEDVKKSNKTDLNGRQTLLNRNQPHLGSVADRKITKRNQSVASMAGSVARRESRADRQGIRLTVIFILITSIYIVTYGPKVWLMIEQSLNRDFWSTVPQGQLLLYRFLHTFYIFNNIVNPIVYGIMDRRFRAECKKRFTRCQ